MKVLFVSPEIVPYAASGGLADVAEALPVELKDEGVDVTRVVPKYKGIEEKYDLEKENHIFSWKITDLNENVVPVRLV